MKKLALIAVTGLLAGSVHAIEYVTLTENTPMWSGTTTDVVEVVGTNKNNYWLGDNLLLNFGDGSSTLMVLKGKEGGLGFDDMKGNVFTGLTSVTLQIDGTSPGGADKGCVTLKITPADEVGATPPGAVLILPENTVGDFNLVVECSDDLVGWSVFTTQTIDSETAKNFYRTRLYKVVAPAP